MALTYTQLQRSITDHRQMVILNSESARASPGAARMKYYGN